MFVCGVLASALASTSLAQPTITAIPPLSSAPNDNSFVGSVSADGTTFVGSSYGPSGPGFDYHAIKWTSGGGTLDLGLMFSAGTSKAWGVSGTGRYVTGEATIAGGATRGFIHDANNSGLGLQTLGVLPGGTSSRGLGMSADGNFIAGWGHVGGTRAFRWERDVGLLNLGSIPSGSPSIGTAISADGQTVVGNNVTGAAAFSWTLGGGMTSLGIPAGSSSSFAFGASADGSVIVGYSVITATSKNRAFLWTSLGGFVDLGLLPTGTFSQADACSFDGTHVVGYADISGPSQRAFLWTGTGGMVDLNTYLPTLGVSLTGWTLTRARAISADGSTIVGDGLLSGKARAWIVTGLPRNERWFVSGASWVGPSHWATSQNGAAGASTPSFGTATYIVMGGGTTVLFDAIHPTSGGAGLASLTIDRTGGVGPVTVDQTLGLTSLVVTGTTSIGPSGPPGTSVYNQTTGTNYAGVLSIGPGGVYNLMGGELSAGAIVNGGTLAVSGTGSIGAVGTISGSPITYSGSVTITGGTHTAAVSTSAGTTIFKTSDTPLTISGIQSYAPGTTFESQAGTTTFTTTTGGPAAANLSIHANATTVRFAQAGPPANRINHLASVTINTPGEVDIEPGTGAPTVLVMHDLSIDTLDGGKLDIGNGSAILLHTDSDHGAATTAQMTDWARSGRNTGTGGEWTGTGILSSVAAGTPYRAVGILNNDSTSIGGTGTAIYPTFQGVTLGASAVIATYTYNGDANCDANVNGLDFGFWVEGFHSGGTLGGWVHGDFNYDTVVDYYDLRLLAEAWSSINGNVTGLQGLIAGSALTPSEKAIASVVVCMGDCPADYDCSGGLAVTDVFDFLNGWFSGSPAADVNGGGLSVQDVFDFLNAWFAGC